MKNQINLIFRMVPMIESPQIAAPIDFGLFDLESNQKFVRKQLKRVVEIIEDDPNYQLVRTGDGYHGWIFLYNKHLQTAEFAIRYEVRNWKWIAKSVTQCVLWNNLTGVYSKGVPSRVFFDYLLKRYPTIMSDTLQTADGNRYWLGKMNDAVSQNLKVGIADVRRHTMKWYDPSTNGPFSVWIANQNAFGKHFDYQTIRYVITK